MILKKISKLNEVTSSYNGSISYTYNSQTYSLTYTNCTLKGQIAYDNSKLYVVYESQVGGCSSGSWTDFPLGFIVGVDYQAVGSTMTQSFIFSSPSGTLISTYSK